MTMRCAATPMQLAINDARRARLQRLGARAVPDRGIDLKRESVLPVPTLPVLRVLPVPPVPPVKVLKIVPRPPPPPTVLLPSLEPLAGPMPPSVELIIHRVSQYYGVRVIDIKSERRTANVVWPRHVAMYLAKALTLRSMPDIGRRFGGRDHTTVLHAIRRIARLMTDDAVVRATVEALENELLA